MNREGHKDVTVFIGCEVEKTRAYGQKTLFLVGVHNPNWIIDVWKGDPEITHIYFGANHSFVISNENYHEDWRNWEYMIRSVLDHTSCLVTVDFDVKYAEDFLESGLSENNRLIPMISVKLPYINQFGYNAVVKIDDNDFNATNPGVWCHRLHDLQDNSKVTYWDEYTGDEPMLSEEQERISDD